MIVTIKLKLGEAWTMDGAYDRAKAAEAAAKDNAGGTAQIQSVTVSR